MAYQFFDIVKCKWLSTPATNIISFLGEDALGYAQNDMWYFVSLEQLQIPSIEYSCILRGNQRYSLMVRVMRSTLGRLVI